jgi:hypothetical protein
MGLLIGCVIVGVVFWSYLRVLTKKRYAARQVEAPDLKRFAEGSRNSGPPETTPAG